MVNDVVYLPITGAAPLLYAKRARIISPLRGYVPVTEGATKEALRMALIHSFTTGTSWQSVGDAVKGVVRTLADKLAKPENTPTNEPDPLEADLDTDRLSVTQARSAEVWPQEDHTPLKR